METVDFSKEFLLTFETFMSFDDFVKDLQTMFFSQNSSIKFANYPRKPKTKPQPKDSFLFMTRRY